MNTLFGQLDARPLTFQCVAMICNTTTDNVGFRISLREIPAFPGPFTFGDAAIAYFSHMARQFRQLSAQGADK